MGREIYIRISGFACVVLGVALAGGIRLSGQTTAPEADRFQPGAGVHETHVQTESSFELSNRNELSAEAEAEAEAESPPLPTRTSFMAMWNRVNGAKGYLL